MGALPWPLTEDSTVRHLVLSEYPLLHYSTFSDSYGGWHSFLGVSPDKNMRPELPPSNLVGGHLINIICLSWDRVPSKRPSFDEIVRGLKKQRAGWSANNIDSVARPVSPGPLPSAFSVDSSSIGSDTAYTYKAKALYACASSEPLPNNGHTDFNCFPLQILHQRTTRMRFPFPRARFWISSTRTASGGKHGKRMAPLEVRGTSICILTNSNPCLLLSPCSCAVKLPPNYLTTTSTRTTRYGTMY
jgi:hypothetical protein